MVHVELKSQFFSYAEGTGGGLGLCWDGVIGFSSGITPAAENFAIRLTVRDASNNNIIQTITTGFQQLNSSAITRSFTIGCQTVGSVATIDVLGEILGAGTPSPVINTFSFSQNNANPPILPVNIELIVANPTYVAGRTAELKSQMVASYQPDAVGTSVSYIMTAEDSSTGVVLNSRKRSFTLPVLISDSVRSMNLNIPDELNHLSIKVAWVIDNPAGGSFTPVQFQTLILDTGPPPPPPITSTSFEIRFTDRPNDNFSSNTSPSDFTLIENEAQQDSRWSTFFLANVEIAPAFTFQQIITQIDAILATAPPPPPQPGGERNLFNTAIVGAIGLGILASLVGGKKK